MCVCAGGQGGGEVLQAVLEASCGGGDADGTVGQGAGVAQAEMWRQR